EEGIRDWSVTGVQTCALPISTTSWLQPMVTPALTRTAPAVLAMVTANVWLAPSPTMTYIAGMAGTAPPAVTVAAAWPAIHIARAVSHSSFTETMPPVLTWVADK